MPTEHDLPVNVFYLATEPFHGGFRWVIRQYAARHPLETGRETFATEAEARKGGRQALIRNSARKASVRSARRPPMEAIETAGPV